MQQNEASIVNTLPAAVLEEFTEVLDNELESGYIAWSQSTTKITSVVNTSKLQIIGANSGGTSTSQWS